MSAAERLIVALDCPDAASAIRLATRLHGLVRTVKVGSVLFTAAGPAILQRLRSLGFGVMLDLKFFDIPSTVEESCRAAARHPIRLLTVHAAGGRTMLEAAVRGAREGARRRRAARPLVLGVTVLTSSALARRERVVAFARTVLEAGGDGVVASAQEVVTLRRRFGSRLQIVCPGIRPTGLHRHDQQRVMTPREALRRGADLLVVGRPITEASNPRAAAQRILKEMEGGPTC